MSWRRLAATALAVLLALAWCARADTYFVWASSPADGPGTSWDTAFHDIQSAVNAAGKTGDVVIVTNGVYGSGSAPAPSAGSLNRVVLTNAITVQSVNGPGYTTIDGSGAVRCVYLANGASLCGFTLTGGTASGSGYGGGVYAAGGSVSNCIVRSCYASAQGGGAYGGAMFSPYVGSFYNCRFSGNSAYGAGGAAYHAALYNCTVVGNGCTQWGGGTYDCSHANCIVYYNTAGSGATTPNIKNGPTVFTCTTPAYSGVGNITNDPQFVNYGAGNYRLGSNSPCINAGTNSYAPAGTDLDGNPRVVATYVDMGACESPYALIAARTGPGVSLAPSGRVAIVVPNDQTFTATGNAAHNWAPPEIMVDGASAGLTDSYTFYGVTDNHSLVAAYPVVLRVTAPWGVATPPPGDTTNRWQLVVTNSVTSPDTRGTTQYVCTGWAMGGNDPANGTSNRFVMTATNDAALAWLWTTNHWLELATEGSGTLSLASGWYPAGSNITIKANGQPGYYCSNWGGDTNGCTLWGPLITIPMDRARASIVASFSDVPVSDVYYVWTNSPVGGPGTNWAAAFREIQPAVDAAARYGASVLVTDGVYAVGRRMDPVGQTPNRVVVTNAVTIGSVNGPSFTQIRGEGPCGTGAVRCAYLAGGAVLYGFTLTNGNTLASGDTTGNQSGGGVYAAGAVLSNCVFRNNSAAYAGGGATYGTYYNCLFAGNAAANRGGACQQAALYNCTVVGNSSPQLQGGLYGCTVGNSIVYYNTSGSSPGSPNLSGGSASYCCTIPSPGGVGNLTNDPQFVSYAGGDCRLSSNSPCINAGTNGLAPAGLDLDGVPRIVGSTVDIGAYEWPFAIIQSRPGYGARLIPHGRIVVPVFSNKTFAIGVVSGFPASEVDVRVDGSPIGATNQYTFVSTIDNHTISASFPSLFEVRSDWGVPDPPCGVYTNDGVPDLTNSVTTPDTRGWTQYVCAGWAMAGNEPASGTTNRFVMTATNNAILTWQWTTNYWLGLQTDGSGTINRVSGWCADGSNVVVRATPATGYYCAGWTGDVEACTVAGKTLVVPMTRARLGITANFSPIPQASTYFVGTNGVADGPGTNWATAFWDVQTAVTAATNGCLVLVTNGVYRLTSAVTIPTNRNITLQSVNGPSVTILDGQYTTRCVAVYSAGAVVDGFSIVHGQVSSLAYGAGLYLPVGTASRCVIASNSAVNSYGGGASLSAGALLRDSVVMANETTVMNRDGGGVYLDHGGTVRNCLIVTNRTASSSDGGGVYCYFEGTVENCTIVGNVSTRRGGGVCCIQGGAIVNSIMYGNSSPSGPEYLSYNGGTYSYCCTTPLPGGPGNITNNPAFAGPATNDYRLGPGSPCIDAGTNLPWMAGATDLDGNPRLAYARADIGAYEGRPGFVASPLRGLPPLTVAFTSLLTVAEASSTWFGWDFDANGTNDAEGYGLCAVTNTYTEWGTYSVTLTLTPATGAVTRVSRLNLVSVDYDVVYVSPTGENVYPYAFRSTAARSLESAVTAAGQNRLVLVTNGVYAVTQAVTIANGITVRSERGPGVTIVDGGNTSRCFTVAHDQAVLDGFTITRGYSASTFPQTSGGGVLISAGTVQNCVIRGNRDSRNGGGVNLLGGLLQNCLVVSNVCDSAVLTGAGGGGVSLYQGGVVRNCTIVSNSLGEGGSGGLATYYTDDGMAVQNSIIYGNVPGDCALVEVIQFRKLYYCCSASGYGGEGTITNEPGFVDPLKGNYRLRSDSLCINGGTNGVVSAGSDLEGQPRIRAGVVDMGAYESGYAPIDALAGPGGSIVPAGRTGVPISSNQAFSVAYDPRFATAILDVQIDRQSVGAIDAYQFLNVTNGHIIAASFVRIPFSLQVASAWGAATPLPGVYTNLALTVLTNRVTTPDTRGTTQYVCTGWAMAGNEPVSGTTNVLVMTATNAASLVWQWTTNYWLTLAKTSGTGTLDKASGWYGAGSNVVVTATPDWGLLGWSGDTEGCVADGATLTIPMTRARSAITANFILPTLRVNSGWGTASPSPGLYTNTLGASLTNSVTTPDTRGTTQYVCQGWAMAGHEPAAGVSNRFVMVATNHAVLDWRWATNYWLVLQKTAGVGALDRSTGWYGAGSNVIVAASPGWAVTNWSGDVAGCSIDGGTLTIPMTRARSAITANFIVPTLEVRSEWGVATPAPGIYTNAPGTVLTNRVVTPDTRGETRYVCRGWTLTGQEPSGGSAPEFTMAASNHAVLTWLWETNFWLTLTGGGTVTLSRTSGWCAAGSNVVVSARPAWAFEGWSGDTEGCLIDGLDITIPMTRPRSAIAAHFADATLQVSSEWGLAAPEPGLHAYPIGTVLTNSVVSPDTRDSTQYVCVGWALTGQDPATGATSAFTLELTNHAALNWQWRTNYWLDLAVSGNGTLNCTSGWYAAESSVLLTAVPAPDHYWVRWSGDTNGCVASGPTLQVSMSRPRGAITASFARHPYGRPYYVWTNSPVNGPGTNWSTAFRDIQSAIDAAGASNTVLVTNGVYAVGARETPGYSLLNRIVITNDTLVRSVNGAAVTFIRGEGPLGTAAVRCVFMSRGILMGFTLTNGFTQTSGNATYSMSGGGVCASGGTVSNCILMGNSSFWTGGGGAGGVYFNCLFVGNASDYGGAAYGGVLNQCTICGNSGKTGGGTYDCTLNGCIVYYNSATGGPADYVGGTINYTCITPSPGGTGNITNAPVFVETNGWGNPRLAAESPCINRGPPAPGEPGAIDLDGNPRTVGTRTDMGAFEYPFTASGIWAVWLRNHGLPTDGQADHVDVDRDGATVLAEYIAGTDPTNRLSCLRVGAVERPDGAAGVVVRWDSVTGRTYSVEGSTNLGGAPTFRSLSSNIMGQGDQTTYTDTNDVSQGPAFYRVRVQ